MFIIIEELIIKNSIRFLNKGTTEIHYTPKREMQLILGGNGYGKSSLDDELSPLPPSPKLFIKGGYKYIRIQFDNKIYELEADFSAGAKYSFKIDGSNNLNNGRTQTIQRTLVEQHFGYTQLIHDVLRGKIDFVKMTPTARKEWLLRLCPHNLDFGVKLHGESEKQIRQIIATVKKTKEKIVKAQSDVLSQEAIDEIKNSLDIRLKQIDELTPYVNNTAVWGYNEDCQLGDIESKIDALLTDIRDAGIRLDMVIKKYYSKEIPTVKQDTLASQIIADVNSVTTNLNTATSRLTSQYEEKAHLDQLLVPVESDGDDSISDEELQDRISRIEFEVSNLTYDENLIDVVEPRQVQYQLIEAAPVFENLISRLPDNPNREVFSSTIANQLSEEIDQHNRKLLSLNGQHQILLERLFFIREQHEIDCPNCQHKWIPGVDVGEQEEIQSKLNGLGEQIAAEQAAIDQLRTEREKQDEYRDLLFEYNRLTRDYPRLGFLWAEAQENKLLFNNPKALYGRSTIYINKLSSIIRYQELTEERDNYRHVLEVRALAKNSNQTAIQKRIEELDADIFNMIKYVKQLERDQQALSIAHDQLTIVDKSCKSLKYLLEKHQDKMIEWHRATKATIINDTMKNISSSIISLKDRINTYDAKKAILTNLEEMVADLNQEQLVLEAICTLLSPYDGYIAELMNGFIKDFLGAINGIAGQIWANKYIWKCEGLQTGDMDYKFPLETNQNDLPIPDVSFGSDGEMEFANFLFMMVARSYLGLKAWPLHLDEVGKYFSEEHRMKLYNYIKLLVESGLLGQVFIISHFPSTHMSLVNADFNYIDPTGQTVPEGANTAIKLL